MALKSSIGNGHRHSTGADLPGSTQQLCLPAIPPSIRDRLYLPVLAAAGAAYPQYLAMLARWERSPSQSGALGEALDSILAPSRLAEAPGKAEICFARPPRPVG